MFTGQSETPAVSVNCPELRSGMESYCCELLDEAEVEDHVQCPCEHRLLLIQVQFVPGGVHF